MPVLEALYEYQKKDPAYFQIPGHRYERGVNPALSEAWGKDVFRFDLTESEGLDDLHDPRGVILQAQVLAAELYGADRTWFLVNGTTCGNEAMILAAVKPGEKIIAARNVHKSVLSGMILAGAVPVWISPQEVKGSGISGSISPDAVEEAFCREPGAKALILTDPTYYGVCSDLNTIAGICHGHNAYLLVDEAHGSHFYFSDRCPKGALELGADLCAQSIHKTQAGLTQASMLHFRNNGTDPPDDIIRRIGEALKLVMSSSPSYLLMASLDCARQDMALHGREHLSRALYLADLLKSGLKKISGITLTENAEGIFGTDPLRVVISAAEAGISGYELRSRLFREGIATELADPENVVSVVTWGNTEEEISRFLAGAEKCVAAPEGKLVECTSRHTDIRKTCSGIPAVPAASMCCRIPAVPAAAMTPRDAFYAETEIRPLDAAAGCVSADMAVPYPPGIPVLCPGEIITEEIISFLLKRHDDGAAIHGLADPDRMMIRTVR